MSVTELQVDATEISDGMTVADVRRIFGLEPAPIAGTPAGRLEAWAIACPSASNVISIADVSYSWDARPRRQKNGAVIGRVYAQAKGGIPRDVGAYKIDAGGRVLQLPEQLRAVLPGGLEATPADDAEEGENLAC